MFFSETFVSIYKSTPRYNPEDQHVQVYCPDALFLINVFQAKLAVLPYLILSLLRIPSRIIRDNSTFMINHIFKISP
jgi:hypothetical protein